MRDAESFPPTDWKRVCVSCSFLVVTVVLYYLVGGDLSAFDGGHSLDDSGGDLLADLGRSARFRKPGNVDERHVTSDCCAMGFLPRQGITINHT